MQTRPFFPPDITKGKMRLPVGTCPGTSLKALAAEVALQNTTVTEGAPFSTNTTEYTKTGFLF